MKESLIIRCQICGEFARKGNEILHKKSCENNILGGEIWDSKYNEKCETLYKVLKNMTDNDEKAKKMTYQELIDFLINQTHFYQQHHRMPYFGQYIVL